MHITDPTAVGDVNEVYDMDVINLDPEDFEYKQITVPLEECSLIYQSSNAALRTRSRIYEEFESCFILAPQARGNIDGSELRPFSMIAAGPGAQGEVVIDRDYENVGWLVPPQVPTSTLYYEARNGNSLFPKSPKSGIQLRKWRGTFLSSGHGLLKRRRMPRRFSMTATGRDMVPRSSSWTPSWRRSNHVTRMRLSIPTRKADPTARSSEHVRTIP